jgi:hypothetical protein
MRSLNILNLASPELDKRTSNLKIQIEYGFFIRILNGSPVIEVFAD